MPRTLDPAITCAENIALLSLFHNIPVPPSSNTADDALSSKEPYVLSFQQEQKLAGTLAFLAHTKDDANHIPAVCIAEDPELVCLKVIVAVNKADFLDGDGLLRQIQEGFDGIFTILATVSENNNSDLEAKVLSMVVTMCSSRILSRLRLASARSKTTKRPIKDAFREAILALDKMDRHKLASRNLVVTAELFRARAREVDKLVDSWLRYQVTARLVDLVEGVYQIQQIERLQDLINMIPNYDMDPKARESLLNIIGKVSRYWEAARFLYRTAKKIPLARKMRTATVHLPQEAFDPPSTDHYTPDLLSKVVKLIPKGGQKKLLKEICRVLGVSEQQVARDFSRQVENTLKGAKIHAEIQIVAHCESNLQTLLPRVICSSKDACFLCNLFVRSHSKMYTPRSHGRLYPRWRLPCLPDFQEHRRRFLQSLEAYSRDSYMVLLSTGRRTIYPCPNESTLFNLPLSATTLKTSTQSELSQASRPERRGRPYIPLELELDRSSRQSGVEGNSYIQNTTGSARQSCGKSQSSLSSRLPLRPPGSRSEAGSERALHQVLKRNGCLRPVERILISAGPLEVWMNNTAESQSLAYNIEWLDTKESTTAQAHDSPIPLVDAQCLEGEVTIRDHNTVYIAVRSTVLKISWVTAIDSSKSYT